MSSTINKICMKHPSSYNYIWNEFCVVLNISLENDSSGMLKFQCRSQTLPTLHRVCKEILCLQATIIVESHHRLAYPPVQETLNNDAFQRYCLWCGYSLFLKFSYHTEESPPLKFTTVKFSRSYLNNLDTKLVCQSSVGPQHHFRDRRLNFSVGVP